jgi:hypothetical protein
VTANFTYRADELQAEQTAAVIKGIRALADSEITGSK